MERMTCTQRGGPVRCTSLAQRRCTRPERHPPRGPPYPCQTAHAPPARAYSARHTALRVAHFSAPGRSVRKTSQARPATVRRISGSRCGRLAPPAAAELRPPPRAWSASRAWAAGSATISAAAATPDALAAASCSACPAVLRSASPMSSPPPTAAPPAPPPAPSPPGALLLEETAIAAPPSASPPLVRRSLCAVASAAAGMLPAGTCAARARGRAQGESEGC